MMTKKAWLHECLWIPATSMAAVLSLSAGCYSGVHGSKDSGGDQAPTTDPGDDGSGAGGDQDGDVPGDSDVPEVEADCPGPDQPRRLNRGELNTIAQDIFGVTSEPFNKALNSSGDLFGSKVSNSLTISHNQVLAYRDAAEEIATEYVDQLDLSAECGDSPSASCAGPLLSPIAKQMLRRPVDSGRVDDLVDVVQTALDNGLTIKDGLVSAITALFLTPDFLYIGINVGSEPGVYELDSYEIATRLALALWNSVPDDELLDAAESGELLNTEGIRAQVDRMLADPDKGSRFIESWSNSFLFLSSLDDKATEVPEGVDMTPQKWAKLIADMKTEAVLTMKHAFEEGASIDTLLRAGFVFVNERLANHYGIEGVIGEEFQRVELGPDSPFGGLLTSGSNLVLNDDLIHRGLAVLEIYLCQPIGAPSDEETLARVAEQLESAQSEEELVEIRLNDPACIGCHNMIDPIGTSFMQFNAVGQYRPTDNQGDPIDVDIDFQGIPLNGPQDVRELIIEDDFASCFAPNILGPVSNRLMRAFDPADQCATDQMLTTIDGEMSLRNIVEAALVSGTFRTRVVGEPDQD